MCFQPKPFAFAVELDHRGGRGGGPRCGRRGTPGP
jgi:hypothetical protein